MTVDVTTPNILPTVPFLSDFVAAVLLYGNSTGLHFETGSLIQVCARACDDNLGPLSPALIANAIKLPAITHSCCAVGIAFPLMDDTKFLSVGALATELSGKDAFTSYDVMIKNRNSSMDAAVRTEASSWTDTVSTVSWASIAAGAIVAAALSLALFALGAGLGLASVSPWADSGVSASSIRNGAGVYLVIVAVMSSAVGGYLAARLRTKWSGIHTNEVFFRDTAHGLIAWAFATVLSASLLAAAVTHVIGGAASGIAPATAQASSSISPSQIYVDRLFRTGQNPATPAAAPGNNESSRAEVLRLWTASLRDNSDLTAEDRDYVARLVSAQTGLSQSDAEQRVNSVIVEAKAAADRARRGAAKLAFWMTAALLFGAFAASLAAVEGGQLRDGTWQDRRLVPRAW